MENFAEVLQSLLAFPLTNVVALIILMSATWWFLKLRPDEQQKTYASMQNLQSEIAAWRKQIMEDRAAVTETLAKNTKAMEANKSSIIELRAFMVAFSDNCARFDEALDGILETQGSLFQEYKNVTKELADIRTSSVILGERISDIKRKIIV